MLRYIYGSELNAFPVLKETMFKDRADQFRTRLGWEVHVDHTGAEHDQYDALNPLYVIWENADGTHGGSMRFLPTTGRTMVNEHFSDILGGGDIRSPKIWECTRYCLRRGSGSHIAAGLMLGGGEIMKNFNIDHFVGVFDARMVRIYKMIGSSPDILGNTGTGRDQISIGLWHYDEKSAANVARRAGIDPVLSQLWFERAFGAPRPVEICATA